MLQAQLVEAALAGQPGGQFGRDPRQQEVLGELGRVLRDQDGRFLIGRDEHGRGLDLLAGLFEVLDHQRGVGPLGRRPDELLLAVAGHRGRRPAILGHRVYRDTQASQGPDGVDAAVVATEWPEFRDIDPTALAAVMKRALVIDQTGFLGHLEGAAGID